MRYMKPQIQKAQRTPSRINTKNIYIQAYYIQMQKTKDKKTKSLRKQGMGDILPIEEQE